MNHRDEVYDLINKLRAARLAKLRPAPVEEPPETETQPANQEASVPAEDVAALEAMLPQE